MTSEIVFTPSGKRYEKVTYAPAPTLERISLSQQDLDDLEHVQPFVLTTTELPKYNVKYVDHVQLDELTAYVFDVAPKTIEKNQRYFQGRIWVEDKDLEIVKTDGKAVPDIRKKAGKKTYSRDLKLSAKTSKATTGFPPTRAPTTFCTSAAATFRFAWS